MKCIQNLGSWQSWNAPALCSKHHYIEWKQKSENEPRNVSSSFPLQEIDRKQSGGHTFSFLKYSIWKMEDLLHFGLNTEQNIKLVQGQQSALHQWLLRHDLQVYCFAPHISATNIPGYGLAMRTACSQLPLEEMLHFLSQCPQLHNPSRSYSEPVLTVAWVNQKCFLTATALALIKARPQAKSCLHLFISRFSDLSFQQSFLGRRTWHNTTCCQVTKHGVAGEKTSTCRKPQND